MWVDYSIEVDTRGPLTDGRANMIMRRYADAVENRTAETAYDLVRFYLDANLRNPTPYYELQVRIERAGGNPRVTDGGVIYGPWLEGVGSRNAPVTRFPGYHTFRTVGQIVDRQAAQIADEEWRLRRWESRF